MCSCHVTFVVDTALSPTATPAKNGGRPSNCALQQPRRPRRWARRQATRGRSAAVAPGCRGLPAPTGCLIEHFRRLQEVQRAVRPGTLLVERLFHSHGGGRVAARVQVVQHVLLQTVLMVRASGSSTADAIMAEPGRASLVRGLSGACSRAEAKGGGAPTGMSATAAVAGKPIHTRPSLRDRRSKGVPRRPVSARSARSMSLIAVARTHARSKGVPRRRESAACV